MSSPKTGRINRYAYDPLDRLVSCGVEQSTVERRFYNNKRLTTQIQGASRCSIVQHDNLLLGQQRYGLAPETILLTTDVQGSVINLSSVQGINGLVYSPYGHHPAQNELISLLGFNGESVDPVTGHYLLGNGYRAYNPVLMRFNSPDQLSPFGKGGINAYAYCSGNPVGRVDTDGRSWWKIFSNAGKWSKALYKPYKKMQGEAVDAGVYTALLKEQRNLSEARLSSDNWAKVQGTLQNDLSKIDKRLIDQKNELRALEMTRAFLAPMTPPSVVGILNTDIARRSAKAAGKIKQFEMMRDATTDYLKKFDYVSVAGRSRPVGPTMTPSREGSDNWFLVGKYPTGNIRTAP